MLPLLIAAGASLAGSLGSSAINANAQDKANAQNMELAKYQHDKNMEMWHAQNAYNAPAAQMQRLKDAGLNPNLVYGSGQAVTSASPPPQYKAPNIQAYTGFNVGASDAVQAALNASMNKAQVDNMHAQNSNILAQNELIKTQTSAVEQKILTEAIDQSGKLTNNARSEFDLNLAKRLESTSIQAAEQNVRKLIADTASAEATTQLTISNTELNELKKRYTDVQISQMHLAMRDLSQDMDYKKFDYELKRIGIMPNDDIVTRIAGRALNHYSKLPTFKGLNKFDDYLFNVSTGPIRRLFGRKK